MAETFWQDVQNCISIVQRSIIPGKNCFLKMLIFSQNLIWSKSCMKFLWQLSDNFDKIAIHVSTETFWTKRFSFWSKLYFSRLGTLTDAFLNIQRKLFCQFCQNGIQRIQRNDWTKLLSYKELELLYHFWTLNEKYLEFFPENFVTVVQIVLVCPSYVFLLFFWEKLCKLSLSFLNFDWISFFSGDFS